MCLPLTLPSRSTFAHHRSKPLMTLGPREHIQLFESSLCFLQLEKAMFYYLMAYSFWELAYDWYVRVPHSHIQSYKHFKREVLTHVIGHTRVTNSDLVLSNIT
ncbi:hypothetical protein AXF42_Ash011811 [Apostasia shenzhenica]|uniref:Uncharacterized protein n=1 Tax=Apostasia shenzhenica TaxID=1088818 RepID=A0A2I0AVX2_9ASPA|nr:hypothetical protein AXF42_Ash011811 [Apostasia shenzhenica]